MNASGTVNVLEAIRLAGLERTTRFYQASTSELYGGQTAEPFDEEVPFNPRSPYAAAKLMGYWVTRNYRDAYGMFACNGILFNHESPRRGETFVTRKITLAVAAIVTGQQEELVLGNINSVRDWGHARDYVECMWRMLQVETPDDFVIATGDTHTVRDFCDEAFGVVGINLQWEGSAESEVGWNKATGKVVVRVSPEFYRPTEVDHLLGNPRKAIEKLGFNPRKTSFKVRSAALHPPRPLPLRPVSIAGSLLSAVVHIFSLRRGSNNRLAAAPARPSRALLPHLSNPPLTSPFPLLTDLRPHFSACPPPGARLRDGHDGPRLGQGGHGGAEGVPGTHGAAVKMRGRGCRRRLG